MDLTLKGKFALVTGATQGIGKATTTLLAREGAEGANLIAFLVSAAASYVTGRSVNLDGGMSGVL